MKTHKHSGRWNYFAGSLVIMLIVSAAIVGISYVRAAAHNGSPVTKNTLLERGEPAFPTPTPEPTPTRAKVISGGVLNEKAIYLPKPVYPPVARAAHASGQVIVQITVDEEGNVISAVAVSGHPLLRASAASAARGAKFTPTKLEGEPVKVIGTLSFNFTADDDPPKDSRQPVAINSPWEKRSMALPRLSYTT